MQHGFCAVHILRQPGHGLLQQGTAIKLGLVEVERRCRLLHAHTLCIPGKPWACGCLQIWYGHLVLQQAEQGSTESVGSALLLAHKALTQVVSSTGQLGRADKALACMLLAKVELLGNLRRKHERAEAHAIQVLLLDTV